MNTKAGKPLPKVGVSSDERPMHYSVGAVITNERGEYFLQDRRFELYGFAGMAGHVDIGESFYQALMREAGEEIGSKLKRIRAICEQEMLGNFCRNDGVHRIDVHYWKLYEAFVRSDEIHVGSHEAKRWGWFTAEEIRARRYVREGKEHVLTLEPVWEHWFTKVGISQ